jgi:hypothetical protein
VATTAFGEISWRRIAVSSRHSKAHEIEHMLEMLEAIPEAPWGPLELHGRRGFRRLRRRQAAVRRRRYARRSGRAIDEKQHGGEGSAAKGAQGDMSPKP